MRLPDSPRPYEQHIVLGFSTGTLFEDVDQPLRNRLTLNKRSFYELPRHSRRAECRKYGHLILSRTPTNSERLNNGSRTSHPHFWRDNDPLEVPVELAEKVPLQRQLFCV